MDKSNTSFEKRSVAGAALLGNQSKTKSENPRIPINWSIVYEYERGGLLACEHKPDAKVALRKIPFNKAAC